MSLVFFSRRTQASSDLSHLTRLHTSIASSYHPWLLASLEVPTVGVAYARSEANTVNNTKKKRKKRKVCRPICAMSSYILPSRCNNVSLVTSLLPCLPCRCALSAFFLTPPLICRRAAAKLHTYRSAIIITRCHACMRAYMHARMRSPVRSIQSSC